MQADFETAIRFLDGLSNAEVVRKPDAASPFSLARIRSLADILGHPERRFGIIHVAGTKGKGSTAAMIASILDAAGVRVGWYTSPHFQTPRERIRIGRALVSPEQFAKTAEEIRIAIQRMPDGPPSQFEAMTAMAFAFFANSGVDLAVIEAGMGGTLDATNVVVPLVSVITSISLDHTAYLGTTPAAIAVHKAGIVKEGGILVTAPQIPEVMLVLREACANRSARMHVAHENCRIRKMTADLAGQSFVALRQTDQAEAEFWIPLLGDHQLENVGVAIETIDVLKTLGIKIDEEAIREGLRSVTWPGRFQIVPGHPVTVFDGAHNGASAKCLHRTLQQHFDGRRRAVVLGTSCDKDIESIVAELLDGTNLFVATRSGHPRSADPAAVENAVLRLGGRCVAAENLGEALTRARNEAGPNGIVCVTGSLFLVGDAHTLLNMNQYTK